MSENLKEIATELLKKISIEAQGKWKIDSTYIGIRMLQIDKRGSFGERFFLTILGKLYPRRIQYKDGDPGEWDLLIGRTKLEIKTSSIDSNDKFQNEGVDKEGNYDGILFLGVLPNDLCIKFVKKIDIPFDRLHNRTKAETGRGYKWDFKKDEMLIVNTIDDIKNEFERVFGNQ